MPEQVRVILAGGGTGGHLFPAMAIAEGLRGRGAKVLFMGSRYGIEARKLPEAGESPVLLNIRGIQRGLNWRSIRVNLAFPFRFMAALRKSMQVVRDFDPQVVVGTGGYSSGLPLIAAVKMKRRTVIQEQNSYPGLTVRKLANKVDLICLGFKEAAAYLGKNWIHTGNPVRKEIRQKDKSAAMLQLNLTPGKPVLMIMGGSQGSLPLNRHFAAHFSRYTTAGIQLLWQCGENAMGWLAKEVTDPDVHLHAFISDMAAAYSAADLVVSRSGAIALAELTVCGKPSVLVPFPQAAGDHQSVNAGVLESRGAAVVVAQDTLNSGRMETAVLRLLSNPDELQGLAEKALSMGMPKATENIVNEILKLI